MQRVKVRRLLNFKDSLMEIEGSIIDNTLNEYGQILFWMRYKNHGLMFS